MNQSIQQEIDLLKGFLVQEQDLGIVIGSRQNIDMVAAALSLYLSLSQKGSKVQVISKKAPIVEVANLVGVDKIKPNFSGNTTKLVVSLPYKKGEVEKVLFTEAPDTINFHLTAVQGQSITPFGASDVKLSWEGGAPGAIITIGVSNIDELDGVIDLNSAKIVNIDNFQGNTRFGDIVLVDEAFSSLSEVVNKVIIDLSLPTDIDIAQNLLDGVLFATRNFTKNNTSPLAFEAASSAMYLGAQRKNDGRQQVPQEPRRDNRPQNNRNSRISGNDFPAMHMQQRGSNQSQNDNRRMNNNQGRGNIQTQIPQKQEVQSQSQDIENLMNKISEEGTSAQQNTNRDTQQPVQNNIPKDPQVPQSSSFDTQNNEDVPDDWLMPKVFKSSKNNN